MESVKGWDTNGVSNIGLLTDGRVNLTFVGLDGQQRNVFIPGASIGIFVVNLIAMSAEYEARQAGSVGSPTPSTHMMGINESQIAADAAGSEFSLLLKTQDGLAMRFHFDRNTIEALATGLFSVLTKHGIPVGLPPSHGSKH